MSHRLGVILDQLQVTDKDSLELRSLKQRLSLQSVRAQFNLSHDRLREMSYFFMYEMQRGLEKDGGSTLKMLPSYVYKRRAEEASGLHFALDLGGTNFRVIRMVLSKGNLVAWSSKAFAIPKDIMENGTQQQLFGFIADCILKAEQDKDKAAPEIDIAKLPKRVPLGFTFSFPTKQFSINSGKLIAWTKGFRTTGVEGQDVCKLLQVALDAHKVNIEVVAICNDTVGTLIARYFGDSSAELGVILGTGSNACYWERAENVIKSPEVAKHGERDTVINMEFGGLDSDKLHVLPATPYDQVIDRDSPNPGAQRMEKMISGMYLGEISRQILVSFSKNGTLPSCIAAKLTKPYAFESKDSGQISVDRTPGLHFTQKTLKAHYGIAIEQENDLYVIREVCRLVGHRAAQLAGMAVAATLLKTGRHGNATVAIDGSVYEKTPIFRAVMRRTVLDICGHECDIRFVLQKDGSGHGAGFIAALAASK